MSSRLDPPKPAQGSRKAPPPAGSASRFDKAFQVWLEGDSGVQSGVGRNITDAGLFVETREPFALGSRVRVTFPSPSGGAEMTLEAEVRYQCFINFSKGSGSRAGLRGVGLRFVAPVESATRKGATLH
jgi:hypothetical protein